MIKPYFQDSLRTYTALHQMPYVLNAFGMVMPERSFSSGAYRYGYNTQEKVDEISGLGNHCTATFWEYSPRLVMRWNIDPVVKEWESPYAINRGNPITYQDPKGDNPFTAFIIGAFAEYATKIGGKMLSDNMSFVDANKSLTWRDGLQITIAGTATAATGAVDGGTIKLGSWLAKPTNQKIVKKLFEVGISTLESTFKQLLDDKEFSLVNVLTDVLTDVGMGHLLKSTQLDLKVKQVDNNLNVAKSRLEDLSTRKNPNSKLVENAKKKVDDLESDSKLYNTVKDVKKLADETSTNVAQESVKVIKDAVISE